MGVDPETEPLFPEALMKATVAQAASWTRVASIVTAARIIEKRADQPTTHFYLAFPDDELLHAILLRVFAYLVPVYRCSKEKLALAKRIDPSIQERTLKTLADRRLNPTISAGGPAAARKLMPQLINREPTRILKVIDEPPMPDLMFEPFQMLRTTIVSLYTEAAKVRALDEKYAETTENLRSLFVHRPYGDGALFSTLDAFIYFALGMRVGIEWGTGRVSVEPAFRCCNIVGQPPIQVELFEVAKSTARNIMAELTRS